MNRITIVAITATIALAGLTGYLPAEKANADETDEIPTDTEQPTWPKVWQCDNDLKLHADLQNETGMVIFDDITYITNYKTQGLGRRWSWGIGEIEDEPSAYRYSIILVPDLLGFLAAKYIDFATADEDGMAIPSITFTCNKR